MVQSLFVDLVEKYMGKLVGKITETFNGKNAEETLLYQSKLTKEYSPTLNWANTEIQNSIVSADVVAMDSSLPLKKRPSITKASGEITKLGVKYKLSEKQLNDINIMKAQGSSETEIASKLLDDVNRAIKGIRSRIEIMFLRGLSTGYTLVPQSDTEGTAVRIEFGYLAENMFKATTAKWATSATATPITDLNQLFDKAEADNTSVVEVYMSKQYLDYCRKTTEGKRLVVDNAGYNIDDDNLATPSRKAMQNALEEEYNCKFNIVAENFRIEGHDGTYTNVSPWEQGNIVAVTTANVGRLVYGTLAEDTNRVKQVDYEKADDFILVSKYATNDPLAEFTSAQALVTPIIDNAKYTYVLDASATA